MIISTLIAKLRAYLRYRAAVHELSQLSDRQLSDIGLDRATVEFAAWDAAQR